MWLKYFFIILLLFFSALIQFSFLPYFNIWGAAANLVFILFFIFIFFSFSHSHLSNKKELAQDIPEIFLAIFAGFFLDVYSASFFGSSIVSLLIVVFFVKKALQNLKETKDKYPVFYFILLFIVSFIFYKLFLAAAFYFINHLNPTNLGWVFLIEIAYNLASATAIFYIYKKILTHRFFS